MSLPVMFMGAKVGKVNCEAGSQQSLFKQYCTFTEGEKPSLIQRHYDNIVNSAIRPACTYYNVFSLIHINTPTDAVTITYNISEVGCRTK